MKYSTLTCAKCGARVAENWYIRHVKSGCKVGAKPPLKTEPRPEVVLDAYRAMVMGKDAARR